MTLETAILLTILAGRPVYTLRMLRVLSTRTSPMIRLSFLSLTDKMLLTIYAKPASCLQSMRGRWVLRPFKYIYAYLAQRSGIFTQDFTDFFITFNKPHHPGSKDSSVRWRKEVMGNSGIDTEIFKPHGTRVVLNSSSLGKQQPAAYVMGDLLYTYYIYIHICRIVYS